MTTTEDANQIIWRGARANARLLVEEIKRDASKQRSARYPSIVSRFRDHYLGNGREHVKRVLKEMHKSSGDYIRPIVYNWASLMASTAASVYDTETTRQLSDGDSALEDTDTRAIAFQRMLDKSEIISKMPEAERRAQLVKSCVVAVRHRKDIDDDGQLKLEVKLDLHWPCDAWALPHPSAPSSWSMLQAFVLTVQHKGKPAFEVWTRQSQDDETTGQPISFSPWASCVVDGDGNATPWVDYAGKRLPFCLLSFGQQSESVWPEPSSDELDFIETLNAQISDRGFLSSSQSHTTVVYKGSKVTAKSELAMGPNDVITIDDNEDLSTLSFDPKLDAMREGERENVRLLAMTKRQSVEAYTADASSPASGVARQIANEPQTKARAESALVVKNFEERELMPVMLDVHSTFVEGPSLEGLRVSFSPSKPKEYEDPQAKLSRALTARDAGLLSDARAAFEGGLYASLADAVAAGLLDEIVPRGIPDTQSQPSTMADRIAAKVDDVVTNGAQ